MIRWLAFLLVVPAFALAQEYFEASGQTVAFTLSPGAKAAWNQAVTPVKPVARVAPSLPGLRIMYHDGLIRLDGVGAGVLSLRRLDGGLAGRHAVDAFGLAQTSKSLSSGLYLVRFEGRDGVARFAKLAVMGGGDESGGIFSKVDDLDRDGGVGAAGRGAAAAGGFGNGG